MRTACVCAAVAVGLSTLGARGADLVELDFSPPRLERFEKELSEIRHKHGLVAPTSEPAPLRIELDRSAARPGERWLEGRILIAPQFVAGATVDVALYAPGAAEPAGRASIEPGRAEGRFLVDLRAPRLNRARVVATLGRQGKPAAVAEALVSAEDGPAPLVPGQRIPVLLDVPEGVDPAAAVPVTFGVPFAAGSLWDAGTLRVVDGVGRAVPHQKEVLARWARQGAVKWVRVDAIVVPRGGCFLEVAPDNDRTGPALRVEEHDGRVTVDTGTAVYVLAKGRSPIEEIRVGNRRLATSHGARGLYVVDQRARLAMAAPEEETLAVEARGPVAACIRLEGWYRTDDGAPLARHITRLEFFADDPAARVQHTLVLTEDTNAVWFRDVGWELAVDAGEGTAAAFAVGGQDARPFKTVPLSGDESAWLVQDRHFHFAHDENHFVLAKAGPAGKAATVAEGERCGDWFAVAGARGGLGWACRDAAWQHPKEYEARPDRLVLHLYSSRAGEELDFRMPALVKKWNLKGWYLHTVPVRDRTRLDEFEKRTLAIRHTATGWAKTHALVLVPLAEAPADRMARAARLNAHPVFALPDPAWTWKTRAAGPMHPKDVEKFPQAEAAIAGAVDWWHARIHEFGEYGFVDYYAGPHLSYRGVYPHEKRYHWATYGLRPGLWRVYLRSGDRATREFIGRANQSFMDNTFAHWDCGKEIRGLLRSSAGGGDEPGTPATLPLYWHARGDLQISSSTDFDQFLYDYYLTGNRRARDVLLQFADGAKRAWSPRLAADNWRAMMMMRALVQIHGLTWDEDLLAMADATADVFSDAGGEVGLTKDRPYHSSTYKTQVDLAAVLDAWEITGRTRYRALADTLARHWWPAWIGRNPVAYMNPQGRIGELLFAETGDPSIAEVLANQIRWAGALYDREAARWRIEMDASAMHWLFQGIAQAQDVLSRSPAWTRLEAAQIGCEDFGYPVSFYVAKRDDQALTLRMAVPTLADACGLAGGAVAVRPAAPKNLWGQDLNRVVESSNGTVLVRLPKDAPEGAYEIAPQRAGAHFLVCDAKVPLVLYAPGYWQPAPPQDPPIRYYFQVPEGAQRPQLFLETGARVFDPAGQSLAEGPSRGWIDLPAEKPGLWSFEATHPGLVRVRNLPPLFAARDPESWFPAPIPRPTEEVAPERFDPKSRFVPGAIGTPGDQALHLAGRRALVLEGGPERPDGDGCRFLPFRQGTIEMFYRPNWSTFECVGKPVGLLTMVTGGDPWHLTHYGLKEDAIEWFQSRSLLAMFLTDGKSKLRSIRCYRRAIFEPGRWVHLAWAWGRPAGAVAVHSSGDVLVTQVFLDGQPGQSTRDPVPGNLPALAPLRLTTGSGFDGAVDELRISDTMRYTGPFTPPARDREFAVDEHTRALFHFNGSVEGASYGQPAAVLAVVK